MGLRRLLRRSLQKDPDQRLHDIADARLELEEAFEEPEPAAGRAQAGKSRSRLVVVAAAAVLAAVAGAGAAVWVTGAGPSPVRRLAITFDPAMPLGTTNDPNLAISPDGSMLVYVSGAQGSDTSLMLRSLDRLEAVPIPGTERAHSPAFSPDGQWVAFFSDSDPRAEKSVDRRRAGRDDCADRRRSLGRELGRG
ncbi:MAG: TolB family protein [Candidatus Rokuibacteriota bacterium]